MGLALSEGGVLIGMLLVFLHMVQYLHLYNDLILKVVLTKYGDRVELFCVSYLTTLSLD